jgi:hypothetical protein
VITTAAGGTTKVLWLAQQTITARHGMTAKRAPVRILAGALVNHTDMIVTVDHGMVIDGLVVNASALVNGTSIDWVAETDIPKAFIVYHIETTHHAPRCRSGKWCRNRNVCRCSRSRWFRQSSRIP